VESIVEGQTVYEPGEPEPASSAAELRRGETISRYLLLERVGAGGMGVVWAAYDPELDRRVAIKLLRPRGATGGSSPEAHARLIREAQAMARLNHPNVIAVHDVGEHGGRVFVAMEFCPSGTLSRWLAARPRTWQEIIGVFVQAGRGLAAAHAVGLVHRDFKPDNVLIGDDGRARVTDFGLARSLELDETHADPPATSSARPSARALAMLDTMTPGSGATPALQTPLTRTGVLLGTPAYMAPEQFANGSIDARSDQFSLCVALWEALFGERPFDGRTLAELREAVTAGKIIAPASKRVPGFVERALRRGLAVDPTARWPDIATLLRELERDRSLGRRRWLVGTALAGSVLGLAALGPWFDAPAATPDPCPSAEQRLEGSWDADRRARLDARLGEGERWILPALDRYANEWLSMHHDACADTRIRGEQSEELLDRRMRCLDDRLAPLGAAVDLLIDGDDDVLAEAMSLLGRLPSIARCDDREYLEALLPTPDDVELADKVAAVRAKLHAAEALKDAHQFDEAGRLLHECLREAEALGYPPLRAQALVSLGAALGNAAKPESVVELLEQGMALAILTRQDELAARAALALVQWFGHQPAHADEALRLIKLVHAYNDRLDAAPTVRAEALQTEAGLRFDRNEPELGTALVMRGLGLLGVDEQLNGVEDLDATRATTATALLNVLAVAAYYSGDHVRSRSIVAAALAIRRQFVSPRDQFMLILRNNLGADDFALGDWGSARAELTRLLVELPSMPEDKLLGIVRVNMLEGRLGEARVLGNLDPAELAPLVAALQGHRQASRDRHEQPIEIDVVLARFHRLAGDLDAAEAILQAYATPTDDPNLDEMLWSLVLLERGQLELARSRPAEALATFEDAVTSADLHGIHDQPNVADALHGQALALRALGRDDDARARFEASLAIWDQLMPAGHPMAALTHAELAQLDRGEPGQRHSEAAERIRARVRDELAD
jgi:tetratricopeptide (TPR) repeat protein